MTKLIEFLDDFGINENNVEKVINKLSKKRFIKFVKDLKKAAVGKNIRSVSPFNFFANSQLSGFPYPCSSIDCRKGHLEQLARFAALYSDTVVIQNPFATISNSSLEKEDSEYLKRIVLSDIKTLLPFRSMFEAGIFNFSKNNFNLCHGCLAKLLEYEEKIFRKKIFQVRKILEEDFFKKVKVYGKDYGDFSFFKYIGDDEIIPHGSILTCKNNDDSNKSIIERLQELTDISDEEYSLVGNFEEFGRKYKFTKKKIKERGVYDHLISRISIDYFMQEFYSKINSSTYLTNMGIEGKLLSVADDKHKQVYNDELTRALEHTVPVLPLLPIDTLVKFRMNETDSFKIYRDNLSTVLKSVGNLSCNDIQERIRDVVLPELNEINNKISVSKQSFKGELYSSFFVASAFISIGLFTGFLAPDVGKIIATIGGFDFCKNTAKAIKDYFSTPPEVKENRFYFLWKMNKEFNGK